MKLKKYIIPGIIIWLIVIIVLIFYQKNSKIPENIKILDDLGSFDIQVGSIYQNHANIIVNGEYFINIKSLDYYEINGKSFEWSKLKPPFFLEKKINNDTVILTRNNLKHYFLMKNE